MKESKSYKLVDPDTKVIKAEGSKAAMLKVKKSTPAASKLVLVYSPSKSIGDTVNF